MSILCLIQNAIEDVRFMDAKNIAPIIEGYCKYTVFEETDIETLVIEREGEAYDCRKAFIVSDDTYYSLDDPIYGIEFINGEPICRDDCNHAISAMESLKLKPQKFIFIKTRWTIGMWRIIRKFPNGETFKSYGSRCLGNWVRIYKAPLLLNNRWINIKLNDTYIFSGMNEDEEEVEFTPEIAKQVFDTFFC